MSTCTYCLNNIYLLQCKDKLQRRQKEIAEDVKVERKFYIACLNDIKENQCFHSGKTQEADTRRAVVLTCLENAMQEGMLCKMFKMHILQTLQKKNLPQFFIVLFLKFCKSNSKLSF
jgi:hypothetical protein